MSGTYIFLGPTIRPDEMSPEIEAVFLPPVSQGDVLGLLRHEPDVIGIVDGYFERIPAVWHKEILQALEQGVQVVGAASMGALRAAELHTFGMLGVGRIFEWYRDGVINADDEVAIVHAPQELDYRPLSEALVNIRASLELAQENGLITSVTHSILLDIARAMPYPQRSYKALLKNAAAQLPSSELRSLQSFLETSAVNQKKLDALALARHIRERGTGKQPLAVSFTFQETTRFHELADRDGWLDQTNDLRISPELLVRQARKSVASFDEIFDLSAQQSLLLRLARQMDIRPNQAEIDQAFADFKQEHDLNSKESILAWCKQNLLTPAELQNLVADLALLAKLKNAFPPDNCEILNTLRIENKFTTVMDAMLSNTMTTGRGNLNG